MKHTHTPGPWFADRKPWQNPGMVAHLGRDGVDDWCVSSMTRVSDDELGPNTHLAAAAPDLLTACEAALVGLCDMSTPKMIRQVEDAIAKAKGE